MTPETLNAIRWVLERESGRVHKNAKALLAEVDALRAALADERKQLTAALEDERKHADELAGALEEYVTDRIRMAAAHEARRAKEAAE